MHLSAEQGAECSASPMIGHVHQFDAGHHLEQFTCHMGGSSVADRCHVDLAWIGLGIGDELGNGLGRKRWIHQHNKRKVIDARDGRDVADYVEIEFVVERGVDGIRPSHQQKRVTIWGRTHHHLCGDVGASARPVLDDEWLVQAFRQPLAHQTRDDIGNSAGGISNDQAHRTGWIILRPCDPRCGRERCSAGCQMQEMSSVGQFHLALH